MTLFKKQSLLIIGLIFCLLLSIGSFFDFNNIAYAETETTPVKAEYIYADYGEKIYHTDDVAQNVPNTTIRLYKLENFISGKAVAYVPYTYYIKVLDFSPNTDYIKVEYFEEEFLINKHDLKYKKEDQTIVEFNIQEIEETSEFTPYPNVEDTVLTLVDGQTYEDTDNNVIYDNTYTYNFIGSTDEDYYVKASKEGNTTYLNIPKNVFNDFKLKANPLHVIKEDPPVIVPPVIPPKSNALRIIIIVGIAVPAVLIMLFIFMPKKKEVIVENDFMKSTKKDDIDYDRDRSIDDNNLQNDKERKFNRR